MTSTGEILASDEDEKIRVYGSTTAEKQFRSKTKRKNTDESPIISSTDIQFEDDGQTESLISSSGSASYKPRKSYAGSNLSLDRNEDTVSVITSRSMHFSWWNHPKVRDNCRVVIGAFVLTVIGFVLILAGIAIMISSFRGWHSLIFFIGGSLFLIPGLYHVVVIYLAATGRGGYTFHNISAFS